MEMNGSYQTSPSYNEGSVWLSLGCLVGQIIWKAIKKRIAINGIINGRIVVANQERDFNW